MGDESVQVNEPDEDEYDGIDCDREDDLREAAQRKTRGRNWYAERNDRS